MLVSGYWTCRDPHDSLILYLLLTVFILRNVSISFVSLQLFELSFMFLDKWERAKNPVYEPKSICSSLNSEFHMNWGEYSPVIDEP